MFGDDRYKSDLRHECELSNEDDVICRYIHVGFFVSTRRWFRKLMLVDEFNPRSRSFYRSTFVMTREKLYHLNFYYYMIHPFSQFREVWEFIQVIVIIVQLLMTPLSLLFKTTWPQLVVTILDVFTVLDMLMSFLTGYIRDQSNCVILDPKLVAKHYLLTIFFCDSISFVNLSYLCLAIDGDFCVTVKSKYVEFVSVTKWLRMVVLWNYINQLKESRQINTFAIGIIKVVITVTLLVLWMSALTYLSSFDPNDLDEESNLLESVRRSFQMLFLVGTAVPPEDVGVLISQMICLLVGFVLNLMVLCQIMQAGTKYSSNRKFNQSIKQLNDYMRHKNLPPALRAKIFKYYDFRYELNYYNEDQIMKLLGPQLEQEILLQSHMHFFSKFPLFDIIPLNILYALMMKMKIKGFMPSDMITAAGVTNTSMYFINSGSVASYTIAGKEIKHFAEGEHFGELALMGDTRHNSDTIIAIDCCEIYVLTRRDFLAEIEKYPDIRNKVTEFMQNYIQNYYNEDVEYEEVGTMTPIPKARMSVA